MLAVANALLGMALGLFLSAFAPTEFQAVQFMPAFVLPQILLCGLLVPRDQMAPVPRLVSYALPLTYAYDALALAAVGDRAGARARRGRRHGLDRGRPRARRRDAAPPHAVGRGGPATNAAVRRHAEGATACPSTGRDPNRPVRSGHEQVHLRDHDADIISVFQAIAGLVTIIDDSFYVVGQNYTFDFDTTTAAGWIELLLGLLLVLVGFFLFTGAAWAVVRAVRADQ